MDRALIVAVNTYANVPDLRGCLADAMDVADLLTVSYGFGPQTVRLLTEADATLPNVRDGLGWLADGAKPGDRRLLHFSGHGSLAPDTSGDEASGFDSVLCLADMDWSPGTYLVDDELRAWIATLPAGLRLAVLIDACHSGTATREVTPASAAVAGGAMAVPLATRVGPVPEKVVLARFVEPPPEVLVRVQTLARRPRRAVADGPDLLALSACRDDQTAADAYLAGGFRGAFSYFLCRALRRDPKIGRAELHRRVTADLMRGRFEQQPQLEAMPAGGGLFGAAIRRVTR